MRGVLKGILVLAGLGAAATVAWRLFGRPQRHALSGEARELEVEEVIGETRLRTAASYLDEGNVYFNVGQYELAIERYTRALEETPGIPAAHFNRASAQTRLGKLDDALADYDATLELAPADADALNNRGMLRLYRSEPAEALADFEGALALTPEDATVIVNRGLAQLETEAHEDALASFEEAATLAPEDASAHYGAAQAAAGLGNRRTRFATSDALDAQAGYSPRGAGDAKLALLDGDEEFMKLLRQAGEE